MLRSLFFYLLIFVGTVLSMTSCSVTQQSQVNQSSLTVDEISSETSLIVSSSGMLYEHIDPILSSFQGLEATSNYNDFMKLYPKVSSFVEDLILQGSGSVIYSYTIVDNIVPFLYICRLTISGDDVIVRKSINNYKTILPPIRMTNTGDTRNIVSQFLENNIGLKEFYDILLSPEVQIPVYYSDLIGQRRSSIGQAVPDNCNELIKKHEVTLFTPNK